MEELCFSWSERSPNLSSKVKNFLFPYFSGFCVPFILSGNSYHRHIVKFFKRIWQREKSFDYIYQRMSLGNCTGVILSRFFKVPLILEYNGSEVWAARNWGSGPVRFEILAKMAERLSLSQAHLVVTVSEPLRDDAIKRGAEPDRVVVYPNCIDPDVFNPARFATAEIDQLKIKLRLKPEDQLLTFVGTFGRWHGVTILAEAIRRLFLTNRALLAEKRARFVLVGDGPEMSRVKAILSEPGIEEFVRITGLVPQNEAPLHLAASQILLSPHVPNGDGTAFFGSPTKLFEYMAMEKVIVASDLEQVGQVLRDGDMSTVPYPFLTKSAILAKPGDLESLTKAIEMALNLSAEDLQKLARAAREIALSKFTWDHHVQAILKGMDRISSL